MLDEYKNALLISDIRTTESSSDERPAYNIASNVKYNEELRQDIISLLQKEERKEFMTMKLGKESIPQVESFLKKNISEEKLKEISVKRELKGVTEKSVINDMELQASFMEYMKPSKALLKFRTPYYDDEYCKNQRTDKNEKCYFPYYKGKLLLQPYAPISSTEMRLVTDAAQDRYYKYDCKEIEYKMFYFNTEVRNKQTPLKNTDRKILRSDSNELSWDAKQEYGIIYNFKQKYPTYQSWNISKYIVNIIERPLEFMSKINLIEKINPEISQISDIKKVEEIEKEIEQTPPKTIDEVKDNYVSILSNVKLTRFILDSLDEMVENCCLFLEYIIKAREGYWKISPANVKLTGYPMIGGTLINYVIKNIMDIEYVKKPILTAIINPIIVEYLKQYNIDYTLSSELYVLMFQHRMSNDLKLKIADAFENKDVKYLKDSAYDAVNKFIIYMINEILYINNEVISVDDESSVVESIETYKSKEGSNAFFPKDYKFVDDSDNIIVQSLVWILCGLNDWLEKDTIDEYDINTLAKFLNKKSNILEEFIEYENEDEVNIKEKLKIAMFYNNFFISKNALNKLLEIFIKLQKEMKYNPLSYLSKRVRRFSISL